MNTRRFPGAAIGIVTNLNDPEQQGRVKVRFPWMHESEESFWARIRASQAGKSRGNFIRPELGDEVLLMFERGDPNQGFIVGVLWNGQDEPPGPGNPDGKNDHKFFQSRSDHQLIFNDGSDGGFIEVHDCKSRLHTKFDVPGKHIHWLADSGTITLRAPKGKIRMECVDFVLKSTKDTSIQVAKAHEIKVGGTRSYQADMLSQAAGNSLSISTPSLAISCKLYNQSSGSTSVSVGSVNAEIKPKLELEFKGPVTRTVSGQASFKVDSFRTENGGPSGPLNLSGATLDLKAKERLILRAGGPLNLQAGAAQISATQIFMGKGAQDGQAVEPASLVQMLAGCISLNPGTFTFPTTRNLDVLMGLDYHSVAPTPPIMPAPFPFMPHGFINPICIDTKPTVLVAGTPVAGVGATAVGIHIPVYPAPWTPIPITPRGAITGAIVASALPAIIAAGSLALGMISAAMGGADPRGVLMAGADSPSGAAQQWFTRAFPQFSSFGAFMGLLAGLLPYPIANGSMTIGAPNVLAEDAPMSMGAMPFANTCSDIPIIPNAMAMASSPVLVGIDLKGVVDQLVMQAIFGGIAMGAGKLASKVGQQRPRRLQGGDPPELKNSRFGIDADSSPRRPQSDCDAVGHPVDPATGTLFDKQLDLKLDGPLPLKIERNYNSRAALESWGGSCGIGWRLNLEAYLSLHRKDRKSEPYWLLHDGELRIRRLPWLKNFGDWHQEKGEKIEFCRADDLLWDLRDREGLTWRFEQHQSFNARLIAYFDRYGNSITLHYDSAEAHHPDGITDSLGRFLRLNYDERDLLQEIKLERRREHWCPQTLRSYRYDAQGRLIETHGPDEHPHRFLYDERNLLTHEREIGGYLWRFHYDPLGRVSTTYGEDLHAWAELEYQPGVTIVSDWAARKTFYEHDEAGQRIKLLDPEGGLVEREFDEEGQLVLESDALGNTTEFEYDEGGRLIKKTLPNGGVYSWRFDRRGWLVEEVDPCKATTFYTRDIRGDAIRIKHPDGRETLSRFNEQGQLIAQVKPDTSEHSYRYEEGLLIEEIHDGISTFHSYDEFGRRIRSESQEQQTLFRYSKGWRLIEQVEPDKSFRTWGYTPKGKVSSLRERDGGEWKSCYDPMGRFTARYSPEGRVLKTERGLNGLYSSHQDGEGRGYFYEYDARDLLSRHRRDDGIDEQYERDLSGALIEIRYSDESWKRFENDEMGQPLFIGTRSGIRQEFKRDKLGRVLEAIEFAPDVPKRQEQAKPSPGEICVRFIRDTKGRVREEIAPHGRVSLDLYRGRRRALRFSDCAFHMERSSSGECRRIISPEDQFELNNGDVSGEELQFRQTSEGWALFGVDGLAIAQLKQVDYGEKYDESFLYLGKEFNHLQVSFDQDGNLLDEIDQSGNRIFPGASYGAAQLLKEDALGPLSYDARGRLSSWESEEGSFSLLWDDHERLREISCPDGRIIFYRYDALNRLIERRSDPVYGPSQISTFLWLENQLVAEDRSDGTQLRYLHLEPEDYSPWGAWHIDPQGARFLRFYADQRGAIRLVSDQRGVPYWVGHYSSYGECRFQDRGLDQRLRLMGMWSDPEVPLYYNRFRWYSPIWGRYISPDPIGVSGGLNPYSYASGDPIRRVDPLGLHDEPGTTPKTDTVEPQTVKSTEPPDTSKIDGGSSSPVQDGYPPRTETARNEAKNVVSAANEISSPKKRKVVTVLTHEDGTVSVGVSGKPGKKSDQFAHTLQKKLNDKHKQDVSRETGLKQKDVPDKYRVSGDSMPTTNLVEGKDGNIPGVCGEPKAVDASNGHDSPVTGSDTRWRGDGDNPYPYTGDNLPNNDGSPSSVEPSQMDPCPTCGHPNNVKEYMDHANK